MTGRQPSPERRRLCGLANVVLDATCAKLAREGMPGVGICAALMVKYATLARETGATLNQALEMAAESIGRAFETAPTEQWDEAARAASGEDPS